MPTDSYSFNTELSPKLSTGFVDSFFMKGASINGLFEMQYKAHGTQKPECTLSYMRISSTAQRSNALKEAVYRSALERIG